MGCWNHTCALTNIPVSAGEDVYVIVLHQHFGGGDHCYPTEYWQPIHLMFEGKYDDYGAVEDCTGAMLPYLVELIKLNLFEMELGENQYHDIAVKRDEFDIVKLFEADHESRLYVQPSGWDLRKGRTQVRLKHVVIRKSVLNRILQQYTNETMVTCETEQYGYKTVQLTFDQYVEAGKVFYAKQREEMDAAETPEDRMMLRFSQYAGYDRDDLWSQVRHHIMHLPVLGGVDKLAFELLETQATDALEELIRQMATFFWLDNFMSDSRKMWCPPSGCGSQNDRTVAQRLLAEITISESDAYGQRWDE